MRGQYIKWIYTWLAKHEDGSEVENFAIKMDNLGHCWDVILVWNLSGWLDRPTTRNINSRRKIRNPQHPLTDNPHLHLKLINIIVQASGEEENNHICSFYIYIIDSHLPSNLTYALE